MARLVDNSQTVIGEPTTCLGCGRQVRLVCTLATGWVVAVDADDEERRMHDCEEVR